MRIETSAEECTGEHSPEKEDTATRRGARFGDDRNGAHLLFVTQSKCDQMVQSAGCRNSLIYRSRRQPMFSHQSHEGVHPGLW